LPEKIIFTSDVELLIFWSNVQQPWCNLGAVLFSRPLSTQLKTLVSFGAQFDPVSYPEQHRLLEEGTAVTECRLSAPDL